jgi:ribosome recycling factor
MNPSLNDFKTNTARVVTQLKEDLKSIRTGRANPAVLEDIIVETYGGSTKMKMMEMATITTDGPIQLVIMPYDSSTIGDVEKAILKSPLGLTPVTQAGRIIVKIPPLSQDQRQKLTKIVSQKVEEFKNQVRNHRDEARKKIKQLHETKDITDDQKYRFEKEIDTATQGVNEEIQKIKESKDKELMEV